MHVKKGDMVLVLAGKDAGKTGAVVRALPRQRQVLVEGVNKRWHFKKKQGSTTGKGELVEREAPIPVGRVRHVDAGARKAKKG
jgi:large subunit ribosomal protein L24